MVRSQLVRHFREPDRASLKVHCEVGEPVRQGNALLVRHLVRDFLQQLTLDRVGVRLVSRFAFLAVAALFSGGCEDHTGTLAR
jgi:hypothetical protein